mgnify:FL=1
MTPTPPPDAGDWYPYPTTPPVVARIATIMTRTGPRSRQQISPELVTALGLPQEKPTVVDRFLRHFRRGNPFQRSFTRFRTELCFTQDEAAGLVRVMPDWDYLRELDDALIEEKLLLIEKSRRVLASWAICCFDVWLAAGGRDPRWPSTMSGTTHRQIVIAALKQREFQGSEWFLEKRVRFILDQFEERGLRAQWPGWPTWHYTANEISNSLGSRITAIPQGEHKMRGGGGTLVHCEELSQWDQAQASINAAIPVIRGGGHLVAVCTPMVGSYASRIVRGELGRGQLWR